MAKADLKVPVEVTVVMNMPGGVSETTSFATAEAVIGILSERERLRTAAATQVGDNLYALRHGEFNLNTRGDMIRAAATLMASIEELS